ncbi:MAG: hypothetical protein OEM26_08340 [Saprospiraceae bacterium]|nr:hypothetical protein [Saprospiraceae bacterium]
MYSISYPDDLWLDFAYRLFFETDIADGSEVETTIEIDIGRTYFRYIQEEAGTDMGIVGYSCFDLRSDASNCE